MAYQTNLSDRQQLTIVNRGQQTAIYLTSSSLGQQQSQTSSFTTGNWIESPQLYQIESDFVIRINSDSQKFFILIRDNSISTIARPSLENAIEIDLDNISDRTNPPKMDFQPMQPMQPLKMGNMSMNLNTMSMQMGDMSLTMETKKTNPQKINFCSQCGAKVKNSDRFCSSCGHQLQN